MFISIICFFSIIFARLFWLCNGFLLAFSTVSHSLTHTGTHVQLVLVERLCKRFYLTNCFRFIAFYFIYCLCPIALTPYITFLSLISNFVSSFLLEFLQQIAAFSLMCYVVWFHVAHSCVHVTQFGLTLLIFALCAQIALRSSLYDTFVKWAYAKSERRPLAWRPLSHSWRVSLKWIKEKIFFLFSPVI